jgi:hypothetical protein
MANNKTIHAVTLENKIFFEFVKPFGDAKATGTPITSRNDKVIKRKSVA